MLANAMICLIGEKWQQKYKKNGSGNSIRKKKPKSNKYLLISRESY